MEKRKKIAMFSPHSDPLAPLGSQDSGGQNIYELHLTEQLEKLGWDVDIFTRWDSLHKKQIANISKHTRVIRLKAGKVSYISRLNFFELFPDLLNSFLAFIKFNNPYDIFHGHHWDGAWMGIEAKKRFNKPFVESFHSLGKVRLDTKHRYNKNGTGIEAEFFRKRFELETEAVKESSIIISLSETEKENLHQYYNCPKEKVVVIPGGVNIKQWSDCNREKAREKLSFNGKEFVLLFVGRFEWRKGAGTLITAAGLLKNKIPNLKVIIVGGKIFGRNTNPSDMKEYERLKALAKENNVEDIVMFSGKIDNKQLPIFYCCSDIFVVPSYYEPFGLVALEGMASKTPVIASAVDGLKTTIKNNENGLLFEPRNANDLKDKILMLYNSKELSDKLAENAYRDVNEHYSWSYIAANINEIYNRLITDNNKNHENSTHCSV